MESWDLYNAEGVFQNRVVQRGNIIPDGFFHRVVHVWIYNERQEFLVQKRAPHLSWFPNKWAATTGSLISGERNTLLAAYREINEELGLDSGKIDLEMEAEIIIGNSLVTIFSGFLPFYMLNHLRWNDEVTAIRWLKPSKIDLLRDQDEFAEYSNETFSIAYQILHKNG